MRKRSVSYLFIYLILATITLTASVFAWVTLSKDANVGIIDSDIPNFTEMISFEVKRQGELTYTVIETITEMNQFFDRTAPGETYTFKIDVDNKLSRNLDFGLYLPNFTSEMNPNITPNPSINYSLYNILDVFYLHQGEIIVQTYNRNTNDLISSASTILDTNTSTTPIKYDQTLDLYRISNLTTNNAISLINVTAEIDQRVSVIFTFVYDEATKDNTYQDLMLSFDGIYVFTEQVT